MKAEFPYDARRDPPAPVLPLRVGPPRADPSVAVAVLVDTGADITVLPEAVTATLGLPRIGELSVRGVGGLARRVPVFAAHVEVAGARVMIEALGLGEDALLGRDLLNRWVATLDGPARVLRLRT